MGTREIGMGRFRALLFSGVQPVERDLSNFQVPGMRTRDFGFSCIQT